MSFIAFLLNSFECPLTSWFRPQPPSKPDYTNIYSSPNYEVKKCGKCEDGTYIEIYIPQNPYYGENGKPKAVIYLHGFYLGPSQIYGTHLQHLVKQGYYVFYPNFQDRFYQIIDGPWETFEELVEATLGLDLNPQDDWLKAALKSTKGAYQQIGFTSTTHVDTYLFGHSLGGLFALSWTYFAKRETPPLPDNMLPQQIVVANPISSTRMNFPGALRDIIAQFTNVVDVKKTGADVTVPVAILHGNEDTIVPKDEWKEAFGSIKTEKKKMYLSFTDETGYPGMYANHEQATVDTSFFPPLLSLTVLNGIGKEDNLNWQYIWYALDRMIRYGEQADELSFDMGRWSNGQQVHPIEVFLPPVPSRDNFRHPNHRDA